MTEPSLPEESIFAQALEIASAAERAAFLDRTCGNNQTLRAEVEALLRAHEQSGDLLDLPENPAVTTDQPAREGPGTVIGPYKLLEQIGEGGMGTVWMAEQTEPLKRRVAVKVVKEGMDSRQVLARFEAERQALALMEHPNIARVLDAGSTPSGRPYFVMELVEGKPITQYCDEHRLAVRQRLELFGDVCRAVQHAHQKGIIHRDLKPSNVLVAPYDGKAVVKVIDFGVAKATAQPLTERTLVTGLGVLVGTPEYMSPEQAGLNPLDVDTRSDIYSLGVLLYALLTGTPPLDRQRLKEAGLLEVLRRVREEEPPTPSNRLRSSPELKALAEQRGTQPARLTRLVRGELDWIVMKALEKDRDRRYVTAAALAEDIQRYLRDEPVQAGPPTAAYRVRKFLKRKRGPLLAATGVLVLLAGILGAVLGLRHAVTADNLAWFQDLRAKSATHAFQLQQALGAWERHDVAKAERLLATVDPAFEDTWEQRHLRELCRRVRRLDVNAGPHVLGAQKPNSNDALTALSADGRLIAFAGSRNSFKAKTPARKPADFRGPPRPPATAKRFDPAELTNPGEVRIYEVATGRERERLVLHASLRRMTSLAFSPNGRQILLSASRPVQAIDPQTGRLGMEIGDQGFVEVFDTATGQRLHSLHGKSWDELDTVRSTSFSPDNRHIAARTVDGDVSVWDAVSGRETFGLGASLPKVFALQFSPDGKHIATINSTGFPIGSGQSNEVWLWDGATGRQTFRLVRGKQHPWWEIKIAFSPDSRRLAVSDASRRVTVYDPTTGQKITALQFHQLNENRQLAFSRDSRSLLVVNSGDVNVFDAETGRLQRVLVHGASTCAISADGRRVATDGDSGTVNVWDFETGQKLLSGRFAEPRFLVQQVALSPDGQRLALRSGSSVRIVNLNTKQTETTISLTNLRLKFWGLAFSPDSKRIIADGTDLPKGTTGTVIAWDVATGQVDGTLAIPPDALTLTYLADGPRLAARDTDGRVYVQDAATGRKRFTLRGTAAGPMGSTAFSRDGKRIATRNGDQTVSLWDLATGRELFTLPGPLGDVSPASFSPDGTQIALLADGNGKVFDATEGRVEWRRRHLPFKRGPELADDGSTERELFTVKDSASRVVHLAYRPDEPNTLISCSENGACGPARMGPPPQFSGSGADPGFVDFILSPDGARMALVSGNNGRRPRVRMWSRFSSTVRGRDRLFEFPEEKVLGVAFTGDTSHFLVDGPDGLRVWDETGQAALILNDEPHRMPIITALSPDGGFWANYDAVDNTLWVSKVATGEKKRVLEWPNDKTNPIAQAAGGCFCFSPDGRRIAAARVTIDILDTETGQRVLALSAHKNGIVDLCWSLDGRRIVSHSGHGTARVWDMRTGKELCCLTHVPKVLAISPDGQRLVLADILDPHTKQHTGQPTVVDALTGRVMRALHIGPASPNAEGPNRVNCLAYSPDGRRIVTGEGNGTVRLWDAATGEERLNLKGHTGPVTSVAFSSDGQRIVSGSRGKSHPQQGTSTPGELKVWDAETGQEKLPLKGHAGPYAVTRVVFSRDGQRIVSMDEAATVMAWEAPATSPRPR